MKIRLKYEKYKKDIIDIYRIFKSDGLEFANDGIIEIQEDKAMLDKEYSFSSRLELKKILYAYFSKVFNYNSPWGLITGTKPQKLYNLFDEDYISNNYLVSDSKLSLLREIDKSHRKIIFQENNIHLYINIPFCPTRCSYCSFPTIVYPRNDRREEYLEALLKEIGAMSSSINSFNLRSLYIGGGTPSSLTEVQLERLLSSIESNLNLNNLEEYTVEAGREDTLNSEKLNLMKRFGVTRISINPQSFCEKTMSTIGRNQDNVRLKEIFHTAYELGFDINMDLIIGLEGEDISDVSYTMDVIKTLLPHNLTIHTLSLKKGSKLVDRKASLEEESRGISEILDLTQKISREVGYTPYYLYRQKEILGNFENIGYTLEGKECIYNIATNEERESIVGLGMTSNSKIIIGEKIHKYTNYKNLDEYIVNLNDQIKSKDFLLNKKQNF